MFRTPHHTAITLSLLLGGCAWFSAPVPADRAPDPSAHAEPASTEGAEPSAVDPTELQVFSDDDMQSGYRAPDGAVVIAPAFDHALPFNEHGVAAVHQDRGWWWIDARGERLLRAYPYDNGPDYLSEGLARFVGDDGKVGYANGAAQVKIPARFDFSTPFTDGLAAFCQGCAAHEEDGHTTMRGGQWGLIAPDGEVVVEAEHDRIASWTATHFETERDGAPVEVAITR